MITCCAAPPHVVADALGSGAGMSFWNAPAFLENLLPLDNVATGSKGGVVAGSGQVLLLPPTAALCPMPLCPRYAMSGTAVSLPRRVLRHGRC
eukprot:3012723-Rhodomonas_salina.1